MTDVARELTGDTMSCQRIEDLVIVVHAPDVAPSDDDWETYVRWCTALLRTYSQVKVLVISGNYAPTSKQRSYYNREIEPGRVTIAVMLRSRALLSVVKVFAWFVKNVSAFDQDDLAGALRYLGVAPSPEIRDTIRRLRTSFGTSATA